ncbi:MAG: glycosyltransferase family 2 protein [Candidatus Hydrogenedentes bacterium]|nr:glycosyltransferase family 2 protein [Candidatus Hydrogenedentota bacterium]
MKLLIVIVNYRTAPLVVDCLRSLQSEEKAVPGMKVAVVDCCSGDESVPVLSKAIADNYWRRWVSLLPLEENAGFARGNNSAIRMAMRSADPPQFVMLLNPDTVVRPGAVQALLNCLESRSEAGMAGSRLEDDFGNVQISAFRFPSILSEIESALRFGPVTWLLARWMVAPSPPDHAVPVDWLSGASLLIRRAVLEEIGLLDEGYFMYYEDVDFCRAARQAGWSCWYVPESRVVHLVSQASGIESNIKPRPAYWFEARRRYFLKNHGLLYTAVCDAAWIASFALWRARRALMKKPDADPPGLLGDFIRRSVFARGRGVHRPATSSAPPPRSVNGVLPPNVPPFSRPGKFP